MQADGEGIERRIADELDHGDLRAAATLALRTYGPAVLRYLRSMLGADEVAHEVFSEFSESLWTALPQFRRQASLRTWAYRLAWTAAQDWKRRAARDRVRRLDTGELSGIVAEIRSATPAHERSETRDRWTAIKAALGDEERSLLILRIDQRLSWREVAQVMASDGSAPDPAALRKRFERLKARLRALATEHGLRPAPGHPSA